MPLLTSANPNQPYLPILLSQTEKDDGVRESELWKVKSATAWDSMHSKGPLVFEKRLWHLLKLSWALRYSNLEPKAVADVEEGKVLLEYL
jgi:hypothetical protein